LRLLASTDPPPRLLLRQSTDLSGGGKQRLLSLSRLILSSSKAFCHYWALLARWALWLQNALPAFSCAHLSCACTRGLFVRSSSYCTLPWSLRYFNESVICLNAPCQIFGASSVQVKFAVHSSYSKSLSVYQGIWLRCIIENDTSQPRSVRYKENDQTIVEVKLLIESVVICLESFAIKWMHWCGSGCTGR